MRLFSPPDGRIDGKDRAQWLTPPFDRKVGAVAPSPGTGPRPPRLVLSRPAGSPALRPWR